MPGVFLFVGWWPSLIGTLKIYFTGSLLKKDVDFSHRNPYEGLYLMRYLFIIFIKG
ncbi:hypothetical protein QFZ31_004421 [Neobacillus niacini]|nr:hypothetical protein [Neobacillus niacini]